MAPARKYPPLNRYLEALSLDQQSVTLTFAELEQLLGWSLPPSALLAFYWTSTPIARINWELSGFTAKLDRLERRVSFTRRSCQDAGEPSELLQRPRRCTYLPCRTGGTETHDVAFGRHRGGHQANGN